MKKVLKGLGIVLLVILILVILLLVALWLWPTQVVNAGVRIFTSTFEGNARTYAPGNVEANPDSLLNGKTIIFLGSSVTQGTGGMDTSFVEFLAAKDGVIPVKEAVSGTTLVTMDDTSYIPRMETIDPNIEADAFVCQLSTNDATQGIPLGTVSDSFDRSSFDVNTVAGAIEYIISYARDTWDCPVVFYTGTKYDSPEYGQMVDLLLEIQEKWGISVIDLWNNEELNQIDDETSKLYMPIDGIHPSRAGYLLWWLPEFESHLTALFQ